MDSGVNPCVKRSNDQIATRRKTFGSRFDSMTHLIALFSSVAFIGGGLGLLVVEAPTLKFWQWSLHFLHQPTTGAQCALFVTMAAAYTFDTVAVSVRQLHSVQTVSRRRSFHSLTLVLLQYTHHSLAVTGLLWSVWTRCDGSLILIGSVIGELPNPPRHAARLQSLQQATPNTVHANANGNGSTLPSCGMMLILATIFITRMLLLHYTAHAIVPYAKLATTKICAIGLLGTSALSIWRYMITMNKMHAVHAIL